MTIDPICGMTVDEATALHAVRDGQTCFICSESCRQKFLVMPATWKHGENRELEPQGKTIYTCPMHPEVQQDHPGDCPKCGMALEPTFRSVTAGGVVGTIAGLAVMIGKPDFLRNEKISGSGSLEASVVKLQEEGKTAMFVAADGKPAGILAVADPIKSTTAEAIKDLHAPVVI